MEQICKMSLYSFLTGAFGYTGVYMGLHGRIGLTAVFMALTLLSVIYCIEATSNHVKGESI